MKAAQASVLAINGGSSSVKFALYAAAELPVRLLSGKIERVGLASERAVGMDAEDRGAREILFNDQQHDRPVQCNLRRSVSLPVRQLFAFRLGQRSHFRGYRYGRA